MNRIQVLWQMLKDAGSGFDKHNVLKLSASLSFYTIFSLGPMLLVIIFFSNFFWERQAIEGTIHRHIGGIVGETAALHIQEVIKEASFSDNNFIAVSSFIILLIASTTVFVEMQTSVNIIWNLKVKEGRGWMRLLWNRLLSFSIVAGLGFLLLVALVINALLDGFMDKVQGMFPDISIVIVYIVNLAITLLVVAFLFAIIFKAMPDAVIRWKDVVVGALFAASLFMIGKFAISFYIANSNMGSSYGSASSLVMLLFWVYYSSIVLYFGAEFTKAYAVKYGAKMEPKEYAVTIQSIQVESGASTVQQNEKRAES
jgi:membrane protein